jgi:transposase
MIRYWDNGLLEISNNLVQNALCGLALGLRNWLFVGPPKDGDAASLCYSLVETCRLNDLKPKAWLTDIIAPIGDHRINRID